MATIAQEQVNIPSSSDMGEDIRPSVGEQVGSVLGTIGNVVKGVTKELQDDDGWEWRVWFGDKSKDKDEPKEQKKVLGMPPFVGYTVIGVGVIITGFLIYKSTKK